MTLVRRRTALRANGPSGPRGVPRWRQTSSLCVRNGRLLRGMIGATQGTRFGPLVTPQAFELTRDSSSVASSRREYEDGERFFGHFHGALVRTDLAMQDVLDLGCGFGGRTVFYARDCGARHVEGIEISPNVVRRCDQFAEQMHCSNVGFRVAAAEALPYPADHFDAVISYDVLEHVRDPRLALHEISRVLRPWGVAWVVFPTYLGARASHLDYLTRIPGLHRIFDPDVIVEVVNEFLVADPDRLGVRPQPRPEVTSLGKLTLPTLNGLTLRGARGALAATDLALEIEICTPIIQSVSLLPGARTASSALSFLQRAVGLPELLIGNIAFSARKGGPT